MLREKKIVYAAAGVSHSIFIDSTGSVYTCGKGKGLLGHGDNRIRTVPTKVEGLEVLPDIDLSLDLNVYIYALSTTKCY